MRDVWRRTSLPVTRRYYPRPVAARFVRWWTGKPLDPPSEAEKRDAIAVLRDGPTLLDHPDMDPLYAMAERIFAEASE